MRAFICLMALITSATSATAQNEDNITCQFYVYADVPFVTVTMYPAAEGHIKRLGEITHYGQTKTTAIEELEARDGELYNLVVEADSNGQELGLVISQKDVQGGKQSKLINPASPVMKEMSGVCAFSQVF